MDQLNQIISQELIDSVLTSFYFFSRTSSIILLYDLNEILSSIVCLTNSYEYGAATMY